MRTAYKVRAYPSPEQAAVLTRTFGCVRLVWNKVLTWRQARYHTEGRKTSYAQTDRYLTELKRDAEHGFLYEVSSVPLQQVLRHQYAAFVNFFAGRARYSRTSPGRVSSRPLTPAQRSVGAMGDCTWARWMVRWSSCGPGRTSTPPRSIRPR